MHRCLRLLAMLGLAANVFAQDFELYVVDVGPDRGPPWQIIKYDQNGQNPEVFVDSPLSRPQDILFLEDRGVALAVSLGTGRITRHDLQTGAFIDDFAAGIGQPTRIKIGADGLLYVLQWGGNGRVLRYDLDGNFVDEFTSVGVSNSIGLDWDAAGNLYVASWDARHVRKFGPDGGDLGLFVTTVLLGPTNLWFEPSGNLLVMDWSGGAIRKYDANGIFMMNLVSGLSEPEGIEFLDNGDFLVGNGGTSSVKQFTADGVFVKDFVAAGLGGLAKPNAVRIRRLQTFVINQGVSDAWFNAATAGQGFLIVVFPEQGIIFLAWFTYDTERPPQNVVALLGEPGHRWVTAQGPYNGDTADLTVYLTEGGVFDMAEPPATRSAPSPSCGTTARAPR